MIILDTNVASELLRGSAAQPQVRSWLRLLPERPATTVMTKAELLSGARLLPEGLRQRQLIEQITEFVAALRACLPLNEEASATYADVVAQRQRQGRPIGAFDALIAAICLDAGATLATRNTADFDGLGLTLVNPWDPEL